jgi:hypothetical protein
MLTMSGGKTSGCLAIGRLDSACPLDVVADLAEDLGERLVLGLLLEDRQRPEQRQPELIIVANWREKTARSLSLTLPPSRGVDLLLQPRVDLVILSGA